MAGAGAGPGGATQLLQLAASLGQMQAERMQAVEALRAQNQQVQQNLQAQLQSLNEMAGRLGGSAASAVPCTSPVADLVAKLQGSTPSLGSTASPLAGVLAKMQGTHLQAASPASSLADTIARLQGVATPGSSLAQTLAKLQGTGTVPLPAPNPIADAFATIQAPLGVAQATAPPQPPPPPPVSPFAAGSLTAAALAQLQGGAPPLPTNPAASSFAALAQLQGGTAPPPPFATALAASPPGAALVAANSFEGSGGGAGVAAAAAAAGAAAGFAAAAAAVGTVSSAGDTRPAPAADSAVTTVGMGGAGGATSGGSSGSTSGVEQQEEEEVPRCHLHRKLNKACKFCKAYASYEEMRLRRKEELKSAALEKLKEDANSNSRAYLKDDKAPLPNFVHFPQMLVERIQKNDNFNSRVGDSSLVSLKDVLKGCETCDTESRNQGSLDLQPSVFICSVYRMLALALTEGQLQGIMNSRSCWIRCAGFMYVRLGFDHTRYWELLADALMDDEEFVPFPGRGGESMTVGQYVEQLLTKDKYGETSLSFPRIPAAQRKTINRRMVLYGQFRKRFAANMEVLERYEEAEEGAEVEICSVDGEWCKATVAGRPSPGSRCTVLPVRTLDGEELSVSLGMLIMPGGGSSSSSDLTRSRGRSTEELLQKYEEQQRGFAVASGKDYNKNSGQQILRVGGVPFVAGMKRKQEEDSEDDEARSREARRSAENTEHKAKMAAIESKYCARVAGKTSSQGSDMYTDGPERMRLG